MKLGSSVPIRNSLKLFIGLAIVVLLFVYANTRTNIKPKFVDKALAATGSLNIQQTSGTFNAAAFGANTLTVSGNTFLTISSGSVGIGTTNPGGKMEIVGGQLVLPNGDFGTPAGFVFRNTAGALDGGLYEANDNNFYFQFGDGDLINFKNNAGTVVAEMNNTGALALKAGAGFRPQNADSTTAIQIRTYNSTPFVNFDSTNQRVGIGTATPGQKLDVTGNANISGTLTAGSFAPSTLSVPGATYLAHSSGNVGIGTASPSHTLQINGSSRMIISGQKTGEAYALSSGFDTYSPAGTILTFTAGPNSVNSGALIDLNAYNSTNGASNVFLGAVAGGTGNGPASFVIGRRTGTTSWAESARVDTNGNVGVGTATPGTKLDVAAGSGTTLRVASPPSGSPAMLLGRVSGSPSIKAIDANDWVIIDGGSVGLNYWQNSNVILANGGGSVGIGNASPGQKLDVAGSIRGTGYLYLNHASPSIILQDSDHRNGVIHQNSNLMYFLSGSGTNGTSWTQNGSYWPLTLNMNDDTATFGGPVNFMEGGVTVNPSAAGGGGTGSLKVYTNGAGNSAAVWAASNNGAPCGWAGSPAIYGCNSDTTNGYAGYFDGRAYIVNTLNVDNAVKVDGNTVIDDGGGWHRTYGQTGWYNGTYGGGWWMQDSTWVRVYGGKHVFSAGGAYASNNMQMGGNPHGWADVGCTNCADSINGNPNVWITSQDHVNMRGPGGRAWGPFDLAELYPIADNSDIFDLVTITSKNGSFAMKKATRPYDPEVAGVISAAPAVLFDGSGLIVGWDTTAKNRADRTSDPEEKKVILAEEEKTKGKKPVALAGRIPVKTSTINGPIKQGDPITSSIIPGVAMKATRAGQIIGKALENFDESKATLCQDDPQYKCGKLVIFINLSWYDPDVSLTTTGDLELKEVGNSLFTVQNKKTNSIIDRIGAFAEVIVAKLQAGVIEAKKLVVNGVDVMERLNQQQREIDELKRTVDSLRNSQ